MNILKKIDTTKILLIFLMIQPILDIYILFEEKVTNIIGFSPSTIIRILVIGILFLLTILSIKYSKKYYFLIGYGAILLIYFYFHWQNALNGSSLLPNNYSFSLIGELFYFIRMLLPIVMAFITYHIKLSNDNIRKTITTIVFIISITIVITNILCLSIGSFYSNDGLIKTNIFEWFMGANNYFTNVELSSRGIFNSANQMGALLNILLPITCFYVITRKDLFSKLVVFFQIIALLMIGTRVSSYTWIFILIIMIILYLFFCFAKKSIKFDKQILGYFVVISVISGVVLMYAPIQNRYFADYYADSASKLEKNLEEKKEEVDVLVSNSPDSIETIEAVKEFVGTYYRDYSLQKIFVVDIYNYKDDPMFWYQVISMPYSKRNDNRQIEDLLTAQIYKINNNKMDKYLGMSFTRFSNSGLYLEKDFKVHFYTLGLVGSSLVIYPFLVLLILAGTIMLIKYKEKFRFLTIVYCFSIALACVISYLSGSVMDQLVITLILGFISGLILNDLFKKESSEENEN